MLTPFLRIAYCKSWGARNLNVILAASGPSIYCFSADDGSIISRWSHLSVTAAQTPASEESSEPPAKRRRLSADAEDTSDRSPDIITVNDTGKLRRKRPKPKPVPSIIKLCVTRTGRHVVAVTGEDKALRVLEMLDGSLRQISERKMGKKPSAIILSPDETAILVADKFGDVYSLPLLIPIRTADTKTGSTGNGKADEEPKAFKPAADITTVHTKGNRKTLENQLKSKHKAVARKELDFEHTLLLGHVSLLTDIVYAHLEFNGKTRGYLLTSDRDEHIRISRGVPQTHVIEGFCLGHLSFVNKLLVLPNNPRILVSGGGDDLLHLWDWPRNKLVESVDLAAHVNSQAALKELDLPTENSPYPIAVTGLHCMVLSGASNTASRRSLVYVFLEGIPAIITIRLTGNFDIESVVSRKLHGNPLDLTVDTEKQSILVAVDPIHSVGSRTALRQPSDSPSADSSGYPASRPYLQAFQFDEHGNFIESSDGESDQIPWKAFTWNVNCWSHSRKPEVDESLLGDLFYGAEHMRKKEMGLDAEDEEEEEEG